MNFVQVLQFSSLILFELCGITIGDEANCDITPTNVDKVDICVYINGGTYFDDLWYQRYCSWKAAGMPYDKYAPITVKVGAAVTCDNQNKCNCPNDDSEQVDCTVTFQHVCMEQILGQKDFLNILCCTEMYVSGNSGPVKGLQTCIDEIPGLADKISECMKNQGPGGPQDIALQNAQEVAAKVQLECNTEPFFFYNGIFDKCISDDSPGWFMQKICAMLKLNVAKSIPQCVEAMGWGTGS